MREIVQSIQNDCFLFFFPSDFWFTESVKYLCFHQKPKFTDSQWGPHFPNLPFKTQLLAVLLSLKPSITSLLIPVNYRCEGQQRENQPGWILQAGKHKGWFPQQRKPLTTVHMGVSDTAWTESELSLMYQTMEKSKQQQESACCQGGNV